MATINFNASEVEPSVGFEAIPAGKYQAVIVDSDMKQNKSGTGEYLQLETGHSALFQGILPQK